MAVTFSIVIMGSFSAADDGTTPILGAPTDRRLLQNCWISPSRGRHQGRVAASWKQFGATIGPCPAR